MFPLHRLVQVTSPGAYILLLYVHGDYSALPAVGDYVPQVRILDM